MSRVRRLLPLPALLFTIAGLAATPSGALAAAECTTDPRPGQVVSQVPVEQLVLAARRVWPATTGRPVTVAVLDTGVDGRHPQLRGALRQGWDFVAGEPGGTVDCAGHGTAVAGLVGARPADGIGFAGIAPGVTVLPVRIADRLAGGDRVLPEVLATAIRWAADQGAGVITVPVVADRPTTALRNAVAYAQARDALVVAAAGTRASELTTDPTVADQPSYPAAYPGVLGVGAVDAAGVRVNSSPVGSHVDIVAPGSNVLTTAPARGHTVLSGTAMAAPAGAAPAAPVRGARPELSAVEVAQRLVATANPVPGGPGSVAYGGGMVDPYRAVTEVLPGGAPLVQPGMPVRDIDEEALRRDARWRSLAASAVAIAAAIGLALLGCAAILAIHRRMRRGHGPTQSTVESVRDDVELAELYFTPPKPPHT
ncbi:S8 family serine peptidase [Micromonospora sp. CPCC 205371]|nr:S8 family serine peptidase [Micromonospora sp. CPCC 205371]